jgi:D-aminopeptidase
MTRRFLFMLPAVLNGAGADRPRARDLGLRPGIYPPGPRNAITDVDGVRVGHLTRIEGDHIRTGVTAILPHGGNLFQEKVAGGVFVGNAFGKLAGSAQVEELGTIETPVVLTNTLSVGMAVHAVVRWTLARPGNDRVRSVNALVGETNDGGLNDIRGQHIREADVIAAIDGARGGDVAEGSVGAGTGTICFGWKGGIGAASRRAGGHMLGVLVQSNFGGQLTIGGVPVGSELKKDTGDGSCMIVVATDAPCDARNLKRLAARALFGMARTGASYSNSSGDFAIAFSTARAGQPLTSDAMSPLFQAALEAVEEAIYNSLLRAVTVESKFGKAEAIPIDRLRRLLTNSR